MLCADTRAQKDKDWVSHKGSIKKRKNGKHIWDDNKETERQLEKE